MTYFWYEKYILILSLRMRQTQECCSLNNIWNSNEQQRHLKILQKWQKWKLAQTRWFFILQWLIKNFWTTTSKSPEVSWTFQCIFNHPYLEIPTHQILILNFRKSHYCLRHLTQVMVKRGFLVLGLGTSNAGRYFQQSAGWLVELPEEFSLWSCMP